MLYNIPILAIIFILGASIGSFANVCIYRIPLKQSIVSPPSHCMSCETRLKALDLVPIVSYLILRGRCRYCGEKISPQYAVVEFLFGVMYIGLYLKYDYSLNFVFNAILLSVVVVLTLIDIKTMEVPDQIIIFGFVVILGNLLYKGLFLNENLLTHVFGLLFGGGVFLIIALLTNAMGGGDIKLMALVGAWLGFKYIVAVTLLSFIIGALISIGLILFKIRGRKDFIPFVPFIALGTILTVFYGDPLIATYFTFLF